MNLNHWEPRFSKWKDKEQKKLRLCEVKGCNNPIFNDDWCAKHRKLITQDQKNRLVQARKISSDVYCRTITEIARELLK